MAGVGKLLKQAQKVQKQMQAAQESLAETILNVSSGGGAIEIEMRAGDALLFVDCIAHGSAKRRIPGDRRIVIYRYGPHWGHSRYGYQPSADLLARLTPERRRIIQPLNSRRNPDASIYEYN